MHARPPAIVSSPNSPCAKSIAQLVTRPDVLGHVHGRDVMFDRRCDVSSGKVLARAFRQGTPGLELVIDEYLRSALQHVADTYAHMSTRCKSDLFDSAMILEAPGDSIVVPYNLFIAGRFREGFAYLRSHWAHSDFSFINGDAGILIHLGIEEGSSSNYESAASSFKAAYAHARVNYYLPEAVYLLGVARAAEGKRVLARETWRFGLPNANRTISSSGVWVNYLMLGQLLGRRISNSEANACIEDTLPVTAGAR